MSPAKASEAFGARSCPLANVWPVAAVFLEKVLAISDAELVAQPHPPVLSPLSMAPPVPLGGVAELMAPLAEKVLSETDSVPFPELSPLSIAPPCPIDGVAPVATLPENVLSET